MWKKQHKVEISFNQRKRKLFFFFALYVKIQGLFFYKLAWKNIFKSLGALCFCLFFCKCFTET